MLLYNKLPKSSGRKQLLFYYVHKLCGQTLDRAVKVSLLRHAWGLSGEGSKGWVGLRDLGPGIIWRPFHSHAWFLVCTDQRLCWPKAGPLTREPTHDLPMWLGLLTVWHLCLERERSESRCIRWPRGSCMAFDDLTSDVRCPITSLLPNSISWRIHRPSQIQGERTLMFKSSWDSVRRLVIIANALLLIIEGWKMTRSKHD